MANPIRPPFDSPTYPYFRVVQGNTLRGAELIPYKILTYLMDLPDANGYTPPTSNDYPRVRLLRYLWNDGARPLDGPLPTPQERLSMLFNGDNPDINTDEEKRLHPKGYRLYPQRNISQSLIEAKTLIKIYPGRIIDDSDFRTVIGLQAEIWTDNTLEANTHTTSLSRTFAMEQCFREALENVDIAGVGTVKFTRVYGGFNGSEHLYADAGWDARLIYMSVTWSEGGGGTINTHNIV